MNTQDTQLHQANAAAHEVARAGLRVRDLAEKTHGEGPLAAVALYQAECAFVRALSEYRALCKEEGE